jgi:hypothetical protein
MSKQAADPSGWRGLVVRLPTDGHTDLLFNFPLPGDY